MLNKLKDYEIEQKAKELIGLIEERHGKTAIVIAYAFSPQPGDEGYEAGESRGAMQGFGNKKMLDILAKGIEADAGTKILRTVEGFTNEGGEEDE